MSHQAIRIASVKRALENNYVLLLTTNSVEKQAIAELIQDSTPAIIPPSHTGCQLGRIGERFVLHVSGTSGAQSERTIGRITRNLLNDPLIAKPVLVLVIGFGWGNPNKVQPGDIVVADKICAVNHTRYQGNKIEYRTKVWESPINDLAILLESKANESNNSELNILTGALASGETYYAAAGARDELLSQVPFVLGGEMEAYDLVPELQGIPWLVIKGISDDAGDTTNRSSQPYAAKRASSLTAELLSKLSARGDILPHREDESAANLNDALIGQSILITQPDDQTQRLNDHLNDYFGPQISRRLSRYSADRMPEMNLARPFTDFLLELAQNSIRHGGSSHISISFNDKSVVFSDDGQPFDISKLAGDRGGNRAWRRFERFLQGSDIAVILDRSNKEGNTYRFELNYLSKELRYARENCQVEIISATIRTSGRGVDRLAYRTECDSLYFDVTNIFMMSRRLDLIEEIGKILNMGKGIFIACHDEENKLFFEDSLSSFPTSKLKVFIASDD